MPELMKELQAFKRRTLRRVAILSMITVVTVAGLITVLGTIAMYVTSGLWPNFDPFTVIVASSLLVGTVCGYLIAMNVINRAFEEARHMLILKAGKKMGMWASETLMSTGTGVADLVHQMLRRDR